MAELSEIDTLSEMLDNSYFGLGVLTSSFMLLFCIIMMTYAVVEVFFSNLKRGGILLIQIAGEPLYVLHPARLHGRIRAVDQAGHRPLPDGVLCNPRFWWQG